MKLSKMKEDCEQWYRKEAENRWELVIISMKKGERGLEGEIENSFTAPTFLSEKQAQERVDKYSGYIASVLRSRTPHRLIFYLVDLHNQNSVRDLKCHLKGKGVEKTVMEWEDD